MKIDHIAIYVRDLETTRAFYETYFGAKSNALYRNPSTGLQTYFLSFGGVCRLEIMSRPDMSDKEKELLSTGYTHLAISVGGKEAVDRLTQRLAAKGYTIISGPRTTGDGYYESCVLDPEGNQVEILS